MAKYTCRNCRKTFNSEIDNIICPVDCPNCGELKSVYRGTLKSLKCAEDYSKKIKELIPKMKSLANRFSELYNEYRMLRETVRRYEWRGIVEKDESLDYKIPSFVEKFYSSRKKRK